MKHKILLIIVLIIWANTCFGQIAGNYTRDSIDLQQVRQILVEARSGDRSQLHLPLPFSVISVEDVRFDTSFIGIYNDLLLFNSRNYKINLASGTRSATEHYLNSFFLNDFDRSENKVVIFLKKLRMLKRDTVSQNVSFNKSMGQLHLVADVFICSGKSYYAAFKIDTLLIEKVTVRKNDFAAEITENLLMPGLETIARRIATANWNNVLTKKPFDEPMVYDNYFKARFELPILTQPYKKGVYRTFTEFINNAPSIAEFSVVNEKPYGISLKDKDGNAISTLSSFGFSNGKHCWILSGNYCVPMIRSLNNFYCFFTINRKMKLLTSLDMMDGSTN